MGTVIWRIGNHKIMLNISVLRTLQSRAHWFNSMSSDTSSVTHVPVTKQYN